MEPVFFRIFDASGATTERTSVVAGFEPVRLVADRTFRKYRRVPAPFISAVSAKFATTELLRIL